MGFTNRKIRGKKKFLQKEVNLTFTSRITICFEITIKKVYVRFMHKQKVTKLGSLKLHLPKMGSVIAHKIDYKGKGF